MIPNQLGIELGIVTINPPLPLRGEGRAEGEGQNRRANRIMERLIGSRNGVMILLKDDDNFGKGGPGGSLERKKNLSFRTRSGIQKVLKGIKNPDRLRWHEVKKVDHYYLSIDTSHGHASRL